MVIECAISNGNGGFINCEDFQPHSIKNNSFSRSTSCERSVSIDAHVTNNLDKKALITSTVDDGPSSSHKVFAGYTVRLSSIEKTVDVCKIVDPLKLFKIAVEATFVDQNEETIQCGMFKKTIKLSSPFMVENTDTLDSSSSPVALRVASAVLTDKYQYVQRGSTINIGNPADGCGKSVDVSGSQNYIVIGCPYSNHNELTQAGSTHIYYFNPSSKKWERYLNWIIHGESNDDQSGIQVSFAEDAFVFAIASANQGKGKVRVYNGFTKLQMGQDIILGENKDNILEPKIALSENGRKVYIGTNSPAGYELLFEFNPNRNTWIQTYYRDESKSSIIIGTSVSLSGVNDIFAVTDVNLETGKTTVVTVLDFNDNSNTFKDNSISVKVAANGLVSALLSRSTNQIHFYDIQLQPLGSYSFNGDCGSSFDLSYDGKVAVIECASEVQVIHFSTPNGDPNWTLFTTLSLVASNAYSTVTMSQDGRTIVAGLQVFALVRTITTVAPNAPLKTPKSPSRKGKIGKKCKLLKKSKAPKTSKSNAKNDGECDDEELRLLCNVPADAKSDTLSFNVFAKSSLVVDTKLNSALCSRARIRRKLAVTDVNIESIFISSVTLNNPSKITCTHIAFYLLYYFTLCLTKFYLILYFGMKRFRSFSM